MLHKHQIENFDNSSRIRLRLLWNVFFSCEPVHGSLDPVTPGQICGVHIHMFPEIAYLFWFCKSYLKTKGKSEAKFNLNLNEKNLVAGIYIFFMSNIFPYHPL